MFPRLWAAVFKRRGGAVSPNSGGHGEGETPLPIPNRAVKPLSADGTWLARARESRTPPLLLRTAARWAAVLVSWRGHLAATACTAEPRPYHQYGLRLSVPAFIREMASCV